jgi:hypothetical protein
MDKRKTTSQDIVGVYSCAAFLICGAIFWYVAQHTLFMYPVWNLAYGAPALAGFLFAVAGVANAFRKKLLPMFSGVGLIANGAALGFMLFVFALGTGH